MESNPRPSHFQNNALPSELQGQVGNAVILICEFNDISEFCPPMPGASHYYSECCMWFFKITFSFKTHAHIYLYMSNFHLCPIIQNFKYASVSACLTETNNALCWWQRTFWICSLLRVIVNHFIYANLTCYTCFVGLIVNWMFSHAAWSQKLEYKYKSINKRVHSPYRKLFSIFIITEAAYRKMDHFYNN